MQFESPLTPGRLIRRYQRFLADVELDDGGIVTANTPNTGSMAGCAVPGLRVWLRACAAPGRKYPWAWELVEAQPDVLVGINTGLANRLVKEGIQSGAIAELQGYAGLRTEVRYGEENSRIDLLLDDRARGLCYVEVKNVTLAEGGRAYFPDAVTSRGTKHLRELEAMVRLDHRAVVFFCVQRRDADEVQPADWIDPGYGRALRSALAAGVEALAYRGVVTVEGVELKDRLPVVCPA